jgi:hypothetical protein
MVDLANALDLHVDAELEDVGDAAKTLAAGEGSAIAAAAEMAAVSPQKRPDEARCSTRLFCRRASSRTSVAGPAAVGSVRARGKFDHRASLAAFASCFRSAQNHGRSPLNKLAPGLWVSSVQQYFLVARSSNSTGARQTEAIYLDRVLTK